MLIVANVSLWICMHIDIAYMLLYGCGCECINMDVCKHRHCVKVCMYMGV